MQNFYYQLLLQDFSHQVLKVIKTSCPADAESWAQSLICISQVNSIFLTLTWYLRIPIFYECNLLPCYPVRETSLICDKVQAPRSTQLWNCYLSRSRSSLLEVVDACVKMARDFPRDWTLRWHCEALFLESRLHRKMCWLPYVNWWCRGSELRNSLAGRQCIKRVFLHASQVYCEQEVAG